MRNCSRVTLVLFRRRALGELSGAEQRMGARVRKSRQKEAAGTADAGLMQIEWSEGEVLKLAGVSTEAEERVREGVEARIAIRKRCDREREVGIGSGAGRTGTGRGEPCGGFELCASRFMPQ
jgi:hypothetical protein